MQLRSGFYCSHETQLMLCVFWTEPPKSLQYVLGHDVKCNGFGNYILRPNKCSLKKIIRSYH